MEVGRKSVVAVMNGCLGRGIDFRLLPVDEWQVARTPRFGRNVSDICTAGDIDAKQGSDELVHHGHLGHN
jgi:hypothetical protein